MIKLAELKSYIGETSSTYDTKLTYIVNGVNRFVERWCNNKLIFGSVIEYVSREELEEDDFQIFLENRVNLSGVKLYRNTGTYSNPVFVEVTDINVRPSEGIIEVNAYSGKYDLSNAYKIEYNAGYHLEASGEGENAIAIDVPDDLRLACLKFAGAVVNKSKAEGESSESLEGASVNFELQFNDDIKKMLSAFKSINI